MKQLAGKTKYKAFVNARDEAAERLLMKTRAKVADELRRFMAVVQVELGRVYPLLQPELGDPRNQQQLQYLHQSIHRHAYTISLDVATHWRVLAYYTKMLIVAGEQQGVINALGGEPKKISSDELRQLALDFGASPNDIALLHFDRLVMDVMNAVKTALVLGESFSEMNKRVIDQFPKEQRVSAPRIMKVIQKVREADAHKRTFDFSDYVSEQDWRDFVNEYKSEFVPKWRDPRSKLPSPVSVGENEEYAVYAWQLERDITDDFVKQVNDGAHAGAKAQGITDFVWIAILDNRTDPCCEKRDGLLISEIREKLKGEWAEDNLHGAVPPLHPNCRCRIAPATDDIPEVPESNAAEFEEWLNS